LEDGEGPVPTGLLRIVKTSQKPRLHGSCSGGLARVWGPRVQKKIGFLTAKKEGQGTRGKGIRIWKAIQS